jgi:hypothetical protein
MLAETIFGALTAASWEADIVPTLLTLLACVTEGISRTRSGERIGLRVDQSPAPPVSLITAHDALTTRGRYKKAGDRFVIRGAKSIVGTGTMQIAKASGSGLGNDTPALQEHQIVFGTIEIRRSLQEYQATAARIWQK